MSIINFLKLKKGVYKISEIDIKIDNSIKKVIGDEVGESNKEILDRALMWGSLSIYLSDKTFTKQEQNSFINKFGKEKATKVLSLLKFSNKDMLDKKVENAFSEATNLLKTDKKILMEELKKSERKQRVIKLKN